VVLKILGGERKKFIEAVCNFGAIGLVGGTYAKRRSAPKSALSIDDGYQLEDKLAGELELTVSAREGVDATIMSRSSAPNLGSPSLP
jgi:hypothetical protein